MNTSSTEKGIKVTITGDVYSGKSKLSKRLAEKFNLEQYSVGQLLREEARNMGMTIEEYNDYMKVNKLDYIVDSKTATIGKENTNFIFDARLAWHFIPDSIKVYLTTDVKVAAKRALKDTSRGSDEHYNNITEAEVGIGSRMRKERIKFKELYGVDKRDLSNYDIVIDTSNLTEEEVYNIVSKFIEFIVNK